MHVATYVIVFAYMCLRSDKRENSGKPAVKVIARYLALACHWVLIMDTLRVALALHKRLLL